MCMSANVNAASFGANNPTLLKLRTAANGPIARVFANASGVLYVKSDVSNLQIWSRLCPRERLAQRRALRHGRGLRDVGPVPRRFQDRERLTANTGTTPVGRVEIGNTQAVTATINFDDIVVDQTPG